MQICYWIKFNTFSERGFCITAFRNPLADRAGHSILSLWYRDIRPPSYTYIQLLIVGFPGQKPDFTRDWTETGCTMVPQLSHTNWGTTAVQRPKKLKIIIICSTEIKWNYYIKLYIINFIKDNYHIMIWTKQWQQGPFEWKAIHTHMKMCTSYSK